eukprot:9359379-Pyramimonas_sp.AAC.1
MDRTQTDTNKTITQETRIAPISGTCREGNMHATSTTRIARVETGPIDEHASLLNVDWRAPAVSAACSFCPRGIVYRRAARANTTTW